MYLKQDLEVNEARKSKFLGQTAEGIEAKYFDHVQLFRSQFLVLESVLRLSWVF